ncbi:cobalamin biosynthesis protein [compost metagenome]
MLFYSLQEISGMLLAAIVIDLIIGDPKWPTHPVIYIGRWIRFLERRLIGSNGSLIPSLSPQVLRIRGVVLAASTMLLSFCMMLLIVAAATAIHKWLGYMVSTWFISTTIAIKGLKEAAYLVVNPLQRGDLDEARKYTGYIVGRDTEKLGEEQLTRAVVETVAENIVDAVISPLFFAIIGGAPFAMLYRSSNTLDSMVGYKSEKYLYFGWASARWDDVMNWIPARITGLLLIVTAWLLPRASSRRSAAAILKFARLHPSPNSGIPESAVAGALGIELGGLNVYGGVANERARLGWPLRERTLLDIVLTVRLLYGVSFIVMGGLLCVLLLL